MARSQDLVAPLPATRLAGPTSLRDLPRLLPRGRHRRPTRPAVPAPCRTPSEPSSATSLATPTSTPSSPPAGPVARPPRNAHAIQERACDLRRQGATLADIRATLQREGFDVSESYLFRVLRRAGLTATRQSSPGAATGRVRPRRLRRARRRRRPRVVPRGRTAIPHQGRWPLPVPSPCCWTSTCPGPSPHAGLPGSEQIPPLQALLALAGPQAPRQATRQSHQRSVL